jgi:hypothetical protein
MDVHVPSAITFGLRRRGIEVLTAQTDNAQRLPDDALLERATTLGRVLFTRDEDRLSLSQMCQEIGKPFAGIIYAHQLHVSIGQCVTDLELIAKIYEPSDMTGRVEYLPLKNSS